jgi:hypothetical protein
MNRTLAPSAVVLATPRLPLWGPLLWGPLLWGLLLWGLLLAGCNSTFTPTPDPAAAAASSQAGSLAPGAATAAPIAAGDDVMDDCPGEKRSDGMCSHPPAVQAGAKHFGSAFAKTESEALAGVASRLGTSEETVQVSGTVKSVCQKAGCWMILKDGDTTARIFTKGANFYLPTTIAGQKAVVEGTIKAKTMSEKFAKHLEEDKGGDPSKVTGPTRELVMNATAVALR